MKKIFQGAALAGALLVLTGCAAGTVQDKRAPGIPGEKTFQLQIENDRPVGPASIWVTVPERAWDRCDPEDKYPDCAEVDAPTSP